MRQYDYLIIGAGLFGSVMAEQLVRQGKRCLVIDKRSHVGGNIYTSNVNGITVHQYGAHIFHTNDKEVWEYINSFSDFNRYTNSPIANYKGKLYNLPFNMNTFYQIWGVTTPQEAQCKIEQQRTQSDIEPVNLEEQAISLVGRDIYEILIKGYTEKQWDVIVKSFLPLLLNAYLYVSPLITIILTHYIRVFLSAVTPN